MFSIKFLADLPTVSESGRSHRVDMSKKGRIVAGTLNEVFVSPLGYWTIEQYQNSWKQSLFNIINGDEKSALITSILDPEIANFFIIWPIYREKGDIFIQNHMIFVDDISGVIDISNIIEAIPSHRMIDEDGNKLSEWKCHISELSVFLDDQLSM